MNSKDGNICHYKYTRAYIFCLESTVGIAIEHSQKGTKKIENLTFNRLIILIIEDNYYLIMSSCKHACNEGYIIMLMIYFFLLHFLY